MPLWFVSVLSLVLVSSSGRAESSPVKPESAKVEIIRNGDFANATKYWQLEQIAPAKGNLSITDEGPGGTRCARVELVSAAEAHWKLSFIQKGLVVALGKKYRVSFLAKANEPRWVSVGLKQHMDPYKSLAHENEVEIGTTWSQVTVVLTPSDSEDNTRFSIGNLGQIKGTLWFSKISIIEE